MATKNEKPQDEQVPAEEPEIKAKSTQAEGKAKMPKSASAKSKSKKIVVDVEAKEPAPKEEKKSNADDNRIVMDLDIDLPKKDKKEPKKETPKSEAKQTAEEPLEKTASTVSATVTQKEMSEKSSSLDRSALVFGGGLLIMGLVLMLGKLMQIPFGAFLWPFIFIIPGGLVLLASLGSDSSSGEGLAILGGILSSLGVLFLAQSVTGWWASWAYAWTLIAPTSVGVAQLLYGQSRQREEIVKSGRRLINLGLTMFLIGFVFFELVLGISGYGLSRIGLPVFPMILIFTGLLILIRSLRRNRQL
jgi:hypothetical protein